MNDMTDVFSYDFGDPGSVAVQLPEFFRFMDFFPELNAVTAGLVPLEVQ